MQLWLAKSTQQPIRKTAGDMAGDVKSMEKCIMLFVTTCSLSIMPILFFSVSLSSCILICYQAKSASSESHGVAQVWVCNVNSQRVNPPIAEIISRLE